MTYPSPTRFLPFPPNWGEAFRENFGFRTTLIKSGDGSEQTVSVSGNYPRRRLEYGVLLTRLQSQRLDSLLMSWSGRFFETAHWGEGRKLGTAAGIGDTTLYGDFSLSSFTDGGRALLWASSENYELVDIATAAIGGLDPGMELSAPLEKAWPAGTKVFPVFPCLIEAATQKVRVTDSVMRGVIHVLCDPANTPRVTASSPAATLYRGIELYLRNTNWKDGVRMQSDADRKVIDKQGGTFEVRSVSHFHPDTMEHEWLMSSPLEIAQFRQFIGRREGRAKPVYMPNATDDLTLIATPTVDLSYIDVKNSMYGELMGAHPARRDIILLLRDGTYVTRRITDVEALTTTTDRINLDDTFDSTIDISAIKRVSFLGLYRLAEDDVEMTWRTDSVATATLDLVLKNDP